MTVKQFPGDEVRRAMNEIEGSANASGGRYAIAAARFNELVVGPLVAGAVGTLKRHGVADDSIDVIWVPGALELPLVCLKLGQTSRYAAIVACGAVIRGSTDHYDVVVRESASGLTKAALETGVPVLNAVLTCDTVEQALDRAGLKAGNKGADAARAALEMASLVSKLAR